MKITDYQKDLPLVNRELSKIETHEETIRALQAQVRRLEERVKKLESA